MTTWFTLSLEAEGSAGQEVVPWDLQNIQVNKLKTHFSKVKFLEILCNVYPRFYYMLFLFTALWIFLPQYKMKCFFLLKIGCFEYRRHKTIS